MPDLDMEDLAPEPVPEAEESEPLTITAHGRTSVLPPMKPISLVVAHSRLSGARQRKDDELIVRYSEEVLDLSVKLAPEMDGYMSGNDLIVAIFAAYKMGEEDASSD